MIQPSNVFTVPSSEQLKMEINREKNKLKRRRNTGRWFHALLALALIVGVVLVFVFPEMGIALPELKLF